MGKVKRFFEWIDDKPTRGAILIGSIALIASWVCKSDVLVSVYAGFLSASVILHMLSLHLEE